MILRRLTARGESRSQEAAYDEAIRLKRDYAKACNNRGVAKRHLGRYEDAIVDYDEAIRLKPDHARAYYNRANVRFTLGHKDEARRDFGERSPWLAWRTTRPWPTR